jgi:hypothetical protein
MHFRAILVVGVDEFFCMLRGKVPDDPGPPEEVPHNRSKGLVVHFREVSMYHHY